MGRKWQATKRWLGRQWRGWFGDLIKDSARMTIERKIEDELGRDDNRPRKRQKARKR